jgi:hypothetical protein
MATIPLPKVFRILNEEKVVCKELLVINNIIKKQDIG